MSNTLLERDLAAASSRSRGYMIAFARARVLQKLARLEIGQLCIVERGEVHRFGSDNAADLTPVTVWVNDEEFYRSVLFGGNTGAGEAFCAGSFHCDDLAGLTRLMLRNAGLYRGLDAGLGFLREPARRFIHAIRRNTRAGSRRNIAAHYDLGNDFFALFLDPTLCYSSGYFERAESTLEEASIAKMDRLCRKLRLCADDHLLEIGTGWGGLALHAATRYGCRVSTTTVSQAQYEEASRRVRAAGLEDRVRVLKQDYRELAGSYDKLVSVEMIEAVGHQYLDAYFRKCSSLLKPEGLMAIQAISTPEQRFQRYQRGTDFIRQYIFPGGCLVSIGAIAGSLGRSSDLRMIHLEDIGLHYARTLRCWLERFKANLDRVQALGYPEEFLRCWEFYLASCEGGFREAHIGVSQVLFAKPGARLIDGSSTAGSLG